MGQGADGRSIFEEGLQIPPMKLVRAGQLNEELLELICGNVRTPAEVRGDILSYVTANEMAGRQLRAMLAELDMDGIEAAATTILDRSQRAVEAAIAELAERAVAAFARRRRIRRADHAAATLTIGERDVVVDFSGLVGQRARSGINVVTNYCLAYTAFALKCIVAPEVPNNTGSLEPFRVVAPSGTILNALRPWPVSARHRVGQMLPDVVFGCLHQALPGRVPAEGASCNWTVQLRRGPDQASGGAPMFDTVFFNTGGTGARPSLDGLSATAFPSGVKAMPIEVVEHGAPIVVWQKELQPAIPAARASIAAVSVLSSRLARGITHRCRCWPCLSGSRMSRRVAPVVAPAARPRLSSVRATLNGKGLQTIPADERSSWKRLAAPVTVDPAIAAPGAGKDLTFGLVSPGPGGRIRTRAGHAGRIQMTAEFGSGPSLQLSAGRVLTHPGRRPALRAAAMAIEDDHVSSRRADDQAADRRIHSC